MKRSRRYMHVLVNHITYRTRRTNAHRFVNTLQYKYNSANGSGTTSLANSRRTRETWHRKAREPRSGTTGPRTKFMLRPSANRQRRRCRHLRNRTRDPNTYNGHSFINNPRFRKLFVNLTRRRGGTDGANTAGGINAN